MGQKARRNSKPLIAITFRLATPADILALEQLISTSVRALSANYYSSQQIESALTHMFGVDTQLITDGTYFVAESDGKVVGSGGWSRRNTLFGGDQFKAVADPLLDPMQDAARIRAFFIHPDWARQGIGRRLIAACEEAAWAEGFRSLTLVATRPGEPLYAALGYALTERMEIVLADGVLLPAARMGKSLP